MSKRRMFDLIVYALFIALVVFCYFRISSHRHYQEQPERHWALKPSVRYQDEWYSLPKDRTDTPDPDEWIVVGTIQSVCASYERPTENNQANSNVLGAKICIHPSKPGYLLLVCEDGKTGLYKKNVVPAKQPVFPS